MKNRLAAIAVLLLFAAPLAAQDEPPIDRPPAAPHGDPEKEKEKDKPKWGVANPPYAYERGSRMKGGTNFESLGFSQTFDFWYQ
jgi:hypothetical protein